MNDSIQAVAQLERPTRAQFKPHQACSHPVLIRGAAEHWRALTAWTPEYLAERSGSAEVPVLKLAAGTPDGKFFYGEERFGTAAFSECLGLLTGAPARVYMASVSIKQHLPALADDVGRLEFVDEKKQRDPQIWISGTDSAGPLHYDLDNNIHVLVSGRKRFLLFEYSECRNLYPFSTLSLTPHYSHVDAVHPDVERFPRLQRAKSYDVTLQPGDMLYLPTGCWHQVVTEKPSVAVNFWLDKPLFRKAVARVYFSTAINVLGAVASLPWQAMRQMAAQRRREPPSETQAGTPS